MKRKRLWATEGAALAVAKGGNDYIHWEDAAAFDVDTGRALVLDGVSGSSRAYDWTELLSTLWRDAKPFDPRDLDQVNAWLKLGCETWPKLRMTPSRLGGGEGVLVPEYLKRLDDDKRIAQCTAALIQLRPSSHGLEWFAGAVGDSCVFHIRDGSLMKSFPLVSVSAFRSDPHVIHSDFEVTTEVVARRWESASGTLEDGDTLLLATDAVAEWALRNQSPEVWHALTNISPDTFSNFVAEARRHGMPNDDSTLVRLHIGWTS